MKGNRAMLDDIRSLIEEGDNNKTIIENLKDKYPKIQFTQVIRVRNSLSTAKVCRNTKIPDAVIKEATDIAVSEGCLLKCEIYKVLESCLQKNQMLQGNNPYCLPEEISDKTKQRAVNKIVPEVAKRPEIQSLRRFLANNDLYNAISLVTMTHAIQGVVPNEFKEGEPYEPVAWENLRIHPSNIFNFDAVSCDINGSSGLVENVRMAVGTAKRLREQKTTPSIPIPRAQRRSVKQLYLTSGDGHLRAAIVIIKDESFQTMSFHHLSNLDGYQLWMVMTPKKQMEIDESDVKFFDYTLSASREAGFPIMAEDSDEDTVEQEDLQEVEDDESEEAYTSKDTLFMKLVFLKVFFPIITSLPGDRPSLICYDGEYAQVEATFLNEVVISEANRLKLELFKLPASTTNQYQPNDVMRAHAIIHRHIQSTAYRLGKINPIIPIWNEDAEKAIKRSTMTKGSRETFLKFLQHIGTIIESAFTPGNIRSCYKNTGWFPLNAILMLDKVSRWRTLTINESRVVLNAVEKLIPVAALNGFITDEQIDEELEDVNIPHENQKSNQISHQRAMWFNKEAVIAWRRSLEEEKTKKRQEEEEAQQSKARRQEMQTIRETVSSRSLGEGSMLEFRVPDMAKEGKVVRCARTNCRKALFLPAKERELEGWRQCTNCNVAWYCGNVLCCKEADHHSREKCPENFLLIEKLDQNITHLDLVRPPSRKRKRSSRAEQSDEE